MEGLYFDKTLSYQDDLDIPVLKKGEALIKVKLAAICNTDKEIQKGYKPGFKGILGHEFVGTVVESDDDLLMGKRVVGNINIGCKKCDFCKKGLPNHCLNRKILGILGKDGAFAEYLTLPNENLFIVPEDVADEDAVFTEPLAAALQVLTICHIRPTDKVAVIGDGKLGQLIARVIALTGCELVVIGRHQVKLKLLENIAKTTISPGKEFSNYFDLVVECTGNEKGLSTAQKIIKARGKILLKSTYACKTLLDPSYWVVNEISLIGTRCGPMDAALRLLERKKVEVADLISGYYKLKDFKEAFAENSLKIILKIN